jgi:hypothetical protein
LLPALPVRNEGHQNGINSNVPKRDAHLKKPSTIRKSKNAALKDSVDKGHAKMNVFLGNEREEPILSIESLRLYYERNADYEDSS